MSDLGIGPNAGINPLYVDPTPEAAAGGGVAAAVGDAVDAPTLPGNQNEGAAAPRLSFMERVHAALEKIADKIDGALDKIGQKINSLAQKVSDYFEGRREARETRREVRAYEPVSFKSDDAFQVIADKLNGDNPARGKAVLTKQFNAWFGNPEGRSEQAMLAGNDAKGKMDAMASFVGKQSMDTLRSIDVAELRSVEVPNEQRPFLEKLASTIEHLRSDRGAVEYQDYQTRDTTKYAPSQKSILNEDILVAFTFAGVDRKGEAIPLANISIAARGWVEELADYDATMTRVAVETMLRKSSATNLRNTDTDQLRTYADQLGAEGRGQAKEAALLRQIASKIDEARTPDGAREMFAEQAKTVLQKNTQVTSFLRGSAGNDASVTKLMDAVGYGEYKSNVTNALKTVIARYKDDMARINQSVSDAKEQDQTISRMTNWDAMPKADKDLVMRFVTDILDVVLGDKAVTMPDSAKAQLKSFVGLIQSGSGDETKADRVSNMMANFIFLRAGLAEALADASKAKDSATVDVVGMAQKIINNAPATGKVSALADEFKSTFDAVRPKIDNLIKTTLS